MEDFWWRTRARVVAYVELILSILASMVVFLITIGVGVVTTLVATHEDEVLIDHFGLPPYHRVTIWWAWIAVASFVLTTGLQLWASLKLLSATEFGMDVFEALDKARFWRNVTFAFLVIELAAVGAVTAVIVAAAGWDAGGGIVIYIWAVVFFYTFWRGNFLFIVYKYMKELEIALASVGDAEVGYIYPDRVFVK